VLAMEAIGTLPRLDREARVVKPPGRHPERLDRFAAVVTLERRLEAGAGLFPLSSAQGLTACGERVHNRLSATGAHLRATATIACVDHTRGSRRTEARGPQARPHCGARCVDNSRGRRLSTVGEEPVHGGVGHHDGVVAGGIAGHGAAQSGILHLPHSSCHFGRHMLLAHSL
jgi:hypothetical protein